MAEILATERQAWYRVIVPLFYLTAGKFFSFIFLNIALFLFTALIVVSYLPERCDTF